jgi:hypothetical protein
VEKRRFLVRNGTLLPAHSLKIHDLKTSHPQLLHPKGPKEAQMENFPAPSSVLGSRGLLLEAGLTVGYFLSPESLQALSAPVMALAGLEESPGEIGDLFDPLPPQEES